MSSEPAEVVEYVLGDSIPIEVALAAIKDGLAFVLTGVLDAWFSLKENATDEDEDALFTKRLGAGISITDPTGAANDGEVSTVAIFPSVEESALLEVDKTYFADLRIKTAAGYIATVNFYVRGVHRITQAAA